MSNHNIHKSSHGLCFCASDPLIDKFYKNLSNKGSEAQKQRPEELLWMLWFDEKSIFKVSSRHLFLRDENWTYRTLKKNILFLKRIYHDFDRNWTRMHLVCTHNALICTSQSMMDNPISLKEDYVLYVSDTPVYVAIYVRM